MNSESTEPHCIVWLIIACVLSLLIVFSIFYFIAISPWCPIPANRDACKYHSLLCMWLGCVWHCHFAQAYGVFTDNSPSGCAWVCWIYPAICSTPIAQLIHNTMSHDSFIRTYMVEKCAVMLVLYVNQANLASLRRVTQRRPLLFS